MLTSLLLAVALQAPVDLPAPPAHPEATVLMKTKSRKSSARRGGATTAPLTGDSAWVVPGLIGAVVPLVLLLLPFMWTPGFGFWAAPFLVVAVLWGAIACGLGGALTWLLCTLLSPTRSGFLWPVLAAAAVGAIGVALTAVVTAVVSVPFFFFGFWYSPPSWDPRYFWYENHPLGWAGRALGFVIWTVGLGATSLASTLVAGWLYMRLGIPRRGSGFEVDVVTPQ